MKNKRFIIIILLTIMIPLTLVSVATGAYLLGKQAGKQTTDDKQEIDEQESEDSDNANNDKVNSDEDNNNFNENVDNFTEEEVEENRIKDKKVTYFKEETSDENTKYHLFKDCKGDDCSYYLLLQKDWNSYPLTTHLSTDHEYSISAVIEPYKKRDQNSWVLTDDLQLSAIAVYEGLRSDLGLESDQYSFKSCSMKYSNCIYYLIDKQFIDEELQKDAEYKLSGKMEGMGAAAGSSYIKVTDNIEIEGG